ncbi:unnamed protein product [Rhodiola kirilowii]
MIIKGIFRRYERWNPVHPTSGAFWGMGIGIGCGVGWGPGFFPEAVGYVGAGCGVGFSVGITLVGFGIGLPANSLIGAPYNALVATQNGLVELARLSGSSHRKLTESGRNGMTACISALQRELCGTLSNFRSDESFNETRDAPNAHGIVSMCNRSILKLVGKEGEHLFRTPKDIGFSLCSMISNNVAFITILQVLIDDIQQKSLQLVTLIFFLENQKEVMPPIHFRF